MILCFWSKNVGRNCLILVNQSISYWSYSVLCNIVVRAVINCYNCWSHQCGNCVTASSQLRFWFARYCNVLFYNKHRSLFSYIFISRLISQTSHHFNLKPAHSSKKSTFSEVAAWAEGKGCNRTGWMFLRLFFSSNTSSGSKFI